MSDNQTAPFRSASPEPVASTRSVDTRRTSNTSHQQHRVGTIDSEGPTPFVYQALEKKPYAVKFLDIDIYHADKDFPDVRDHAKILDEYVIRQAKAQGLRDEPSSYKEVIDAIYKQIGRTPNEDPVKSLKRLAIAAGALDRLNKAKLQPILSAQNLSPEEFEEVQA